MCGICGFYGMNDKGTLNKMCKALYFRGPDDHGDYTDSKISMGHRRLSIIDLRKIAKQPMHNENKDIWVAYNGEIYNFKDIKLELEKKGHKFYTNTDTEVIIHAYEEYSENCLSLFNGMFAFALWDSRKKKLFLARDRLGIKPLYYYFKDGLFIFASEIKSILQYEGIKKEISLGSLNDFLAFRYVIGDSTILKDIKRLLPGHCLVLENDKLKIKKYWDVNFNYNNKPLEYNSKKIRELLSESVERRLISDVPLGALLSGGIDSSAIVALMKNYTDNIKTFTIGFEGEPDNEFEYASQVAEKFETDHREIMLKKTSLKLLPKIIYHMDEPVGDLTTIPAYSIFENAKKYVTVILMGEGSDEIMMGYEQYRIMDFSKRYNKLIPTFVKKHLIKGLVKILPKEETAFEKLSDYLGNIEDTSLSYYSLVSVFNSFEKKLLYSKKAIDGINDISSDYAAIAGYFRKARNYLDQIMYYELKTWLPNDILLRCDRMTMAHSMEGRVPFLDYKLVEFSATVPSSLKLRKTTEKFILKKAMSGILPDEIIKRKKQRFFTPIDHWFGKEFDAAARSLLTEPNFVNKNYFNKDYIEKLLDYKKRYSYKLILKHNKLLKQYYSRQIWSLMTFEIWYKIFVEGIKLDKIM